MVYSFNWGDVVDLMVWHLPARVNVVGSGLAFGGEII